MVKYLYYIIGLLLVSLNGLSQELNLEAISNWRDTGTTRYNDCWAWAQDGKEYAVIGSRFGAHIIDVTDPQNIFEVDRVRGRHFGSNVIHRDYKTYNGYLYAVGDQGNASLQIIDLSYLPDSVHLVYDEDSLLVRSHNIFIDTVNARLYSGGGSKIGGGNHLRIIDISNPTNPFLLVDCLTEFPWWQVFVGYVHDLYVRDNIAYVHDEDAFHIIDFTDPLNPVVTGQLSMYVDEGYNHSGWLHEDGSKYIMFDETIGKRIKMLDVSNPVDIKVDDAFGVYTGDNTNTIAHNGFFLGDLAYVSYYDDGVYVYDCTDPQNVEIEGYYYINNGPFGTGSAGVWGVYPYLPSGNIIASDMGSGLHVLKWKTPEVFIESGVDTTYFEGEVTFGAPLRVSLSHATSHNDITVDLSFDTVSSTADTNDFDFIFSDLTGDLPRSITFEKNYTKSFAFDVSMEGDMIPESDEYIKLKLSNLIGATLGKDELTLIIKDTLITSVESLEKDLLKIYPNPISQGENINFSEPISYVLFDISGNKIKEANLANQLNTANLTRGVYILRSSKQTVYRIIVN